MDNEAFDSVSVDNVPDFSKLGYNRFTNEEREYLKKIIYSMRKVKPEMTREKLEEMYRINLLDLPLTLPKNRYLPDGSRSLESEIRRL